MDPLVHVAEQAPGVFVGAKMIIYCIGFVIFCTSMLLARRAIEVPNSGQGPIIFAGLLGGSMMLVVPALPDVLLASVYGNSVTAQPLLSRIDGGDPVNTSRAAAFQILALVGWVYAMKGLVMFARGAPRGTTTYAAAFWTFVAGSLCTAPMAFFNLASNSLGFGPMLNAVP